MGEWKETYKTDGTKAVSFYSFVCSSCAEEIDIDERDLEWPAKIFCPVCGSLMLEDKADIDELKF